MVGHRIADDVRGVGSRARFGEQRAIPPRQSGLFVWKASQQKLHGPLEPFVRIGMRPPEPLDEARVRRGERVPCVAIVLENCGWEGSGLRMLTHPWQVELPSADDRLTAIVRRLELNEVDSRGVDALPSKKPECAFGHRRRVRLAGPEL